jgi:hypothetical protein
MKPEGHFRLRAAPISKKRTGAKGPAMRTAEVVFELTGNPSDEGAPWGAR